MAIVRCEDFQRDFQIDQSSDQIIRHPPSAIDRSTDLYSVASSRVLLARES